MIKLLHGDCLELMKNIPDNSIDMCLTDPPYVTTKRGNCGGTQGILNNKHALNGKMFKENNLDINEALKELNRVLIDNAHGYIFTNNKNLRSYLNEISNYFSIYKTLIWVKNNCITNMYYMDSHEYIIFFRKGKAKKINNCGTKTTLLYNNVTSKAHPTQKPIELLECIITNSTNENETVLDFTMGSGSTGVACKNLSRKFIGIEKEKKYYDIACERLSYK